MNRANRGEQRLFVKVQAPTIEEIMEVKAVIEEVYIVTKSRLRESDRGGYHLFLDILRRRENG